MRALLVPLALLVSAPAFACTVHLSGPIDGAVKSYSPKFRWTGTSDCVRYVVQFSPGGTFQPGDLVEKPRTTTLFKWTENAWAAHLTTDWANGVYWRVQGFDASNVATHTHKRFLDVDADADGFGVAEGDCDDTDPATYPRPYAADDTDGDGFPGSSMGTLCTGSAQADFDCNDSNVTVYPGAPLLCDGLDNNCDFQGDSGSNQSWYPDLDLDTQGDDQASATITCEPPDRHWSTIHFDCDDSDPSIFFGSIEMCNTGVDEDCDTLVDEVACVP